MKKINRLISYHGFDMKDVEIIETTTDSVIISHKDKKYKLTGEIKEKLKDEYDNIKKPRGWHFMKEFVDSEKNVYYFGVIQPNLKGTLEPTK